MSERGELPGCAAVAFALPRLIDAHVTLEEPLIAHVEQCLSCRAELARYRRLLRLLGQLRADLERVPPGAISDVLSAIGRYGEARAIRSVLAGRRLAYLAGLGVGVAAASGAVFVARTHGRRSARVEA